MPPRRGGKVVAPATKGGMHFQRPQGGCEGFRRQRRHKKWRLWRRTSPAGTVSQPIGKPFNGQAKGLLWLTWRSYAGPPQYYITPEGGSPQPACKAKPITGRTLGAQGRRPGGAINPRGEAASTFGNTGKHRLSPGPDRAIRRLSIISFYAAADR